MATLEEMTAWTLDEIHAETRGLLPEGWRFEFRTEPTGWQARFFNAEGEVAWQNTFIDPRILLFDAYGWLQQREYKTVNPMWKPREDRTFVPVYRGVSRGVAVPDPEDLDPASVAAVYSGRTKR